MKRFHLIDRQPKPQRHLGVLNSDATLKPYLDKLDAMPRKHAIVTNSRTPIIRRAWRWLCRLFS